MTRCEQRQDPAGVCETMPHARALWLMKCTGEMAAAWSLGHNHAAAMWSIEAVFANLCVWVARDHAAAELRIESILESFARGDAEAPSPLSLEPRYMLDLTRRSQERGGVLPEHLTRGLRAIAMHRLKAAGVDS